MNTLSTPLRVLHVIPGLGMGGAEQVLHRLLGHLPGMGFASQVLSLRGPGKLGRALLDDGTPLVPARPGAVSNVLREWRPDILQGWMYHGNLAAWFLRQALLPGAALSWNIRTTLLPWEQFKSSTRLTIRACLPLSVQADAIIYNSSVSMAQHQDYGFPLQRAHWIPNGFDLERFCPGDGLRESVRHGWTCGPDAILVGVIARFDPIKNHRGFIQAFGAARNRAPEVKAVLIGPGMTPSNMELMEWIKEEALTDAIILAGPVDDLSAMIPALDVVVSASTTEGFPNVIGEAMACGVPCIATDAGDSRYLLGDCGSVVPVGDPAALADAIVCLASTPTIARRHKGLAARERIQSGFTLRAMASGYAGIYRSIVDRL